MRPFLVTITLILSPILFAQSLTGTIRGKVVDKNTEEQLIGVLVAATLDLDLGIMPNMAAVFTATQAQIYTPTGELAYYDPGNTLAGMMIAGETYLTATLGHHWQLIGNFNFFQSYIKKAHLDHQGYVSQRLRGSHYGLSLGYRL